MRMAGTRFRLPQASGPRIFREGQNRISPRSESLDGPRARPRQKAQADSGLFPPAFLPTRPGTRPRVPNAPASRVSSWTRRPDSSLSHLGRSQAKVPRGARSRRHRAGESCPNLLRGPQNIPARQPKTRIRKTTPHEGLLVSQAAELSGGSLAVANHVAGRRGKAPAQGTRQRAGDGARQLRQTWLAARARMRALTRVGLAYS